MSEQDAWRRKIVELVNTLDLKALQLVYFFIIGLERRNVRTAKTKK